jgi:hypothetical protein
MSNELRNFLALSHDSMKDLNLKGKKQRRDRIAWVRVCGEGRQEPVFCNASCAERASSPVRPDCRAVCNLM